MRMIIPKNLETSGITYPLHRPHNVHAHRRASGWGVLLERSEAPGFAPISRACELPVRRTMNYSAPCRRNKERAVSAIVVSA